MPANRILRPALLLLLAAPDLHAQMTPEQIHEANARHRPIPTPTNLQVLPPDIAVPDLVEAMVRMAEGLGVQCTYCHAFTPDHKNLDFKADTKPEKSKARIMLRMTKDLNGKYLAELAAPKTGTVVGCGTCHQGQPVPVAYKPPPDFKLQ